MHQQKNGFLNGAKKLLNYQCAMPTCNFKCMYLRKWFLSARICEREMLPKSQHTNYYAALKV